MEMEMEKFQKLMEELRRLGKGCIESKDPSSEACKWFSELLGATGAEMGRISKEISSSFRSMYEKLRPISYNPSYYGKDVLK